MDRNLKLYSWYTVLGNFYAFTPIFFLYFIQHLNLEEILFIEGLYYLSVVVLEVPSGYFSDRFGRKKTLILSAAAKTLACVLFLMGDNVLTFALGQIVLGLGFAFNSGSDTSLHYDSLVQLEREKEYRKREATVTQRNLLSHAYSSLIGGLIAGIGLHWAYVLSGLTWLGSFFVAFLFEEPETESLAQKNMALQIKDCFGFLKNGLLFWVFAFTVTMIVLQHVPYLFYQPYLDLLREKFDFSASSTPIAAGIVTFATKFIASYGAKYSDHLNNRWGLVPMALTVVAGNTFVILAMALILHPAIIVILLLRSLPLSVTDAPIKAAISPRVPASHRATYFSIQSLVGRLSFSATLFALSFVGNIKTADWETLSLLLYYCVAIGAVSFFVLFSARSKAQKILR